MENHKETDEEIGLYIILNSIDYDDCDKDLVDVYDYVTKKYKIDARDSLKHEYITKKNKISK